jgi:hypothetical protein
MREADGHAVDEEQAKPKSSKVATVGYTTGGRREQWLKSARRGRAATVIATQLWWRSGRSGCCRFGASIDATASLACQATVAHLVWLDRTPQMAVGSVAAAPQYNIAQLSSLFFGVGIGHRLEASRYCRLKSPNLAVVCTRLVQDLASCALRFS